ncbi:Cyclic di-GMP phosphodiesterase YfgF [Maioricimonas rarisocia]|uniref:Cyclic di-GMP phosphodiesterase YfgF n=1 Tax=Maioricimonas rarisocia TaxID=2528026 RepID=A0A517Z9I9_9PLAN|nr:EAL domain-containing protein [Maioricimonas rarisocia]QDU39133.1 Cyclic di-GMP phosphodiesterase YfgF [Maioricimonas rarisocia]
MNPLLVDSDTPAPLSQADSGWFLVGCAAPGQPAQHFQISKETFTIGRRQGADLKLGSMRVSGRHAEIVSISGNLFLRDLNSTNGTFVNRKRITQPTPISPGDHIELADMEFRVEHKDPVVEATSSDSHSCMRQTIQEIDSFESEWVLTQFDELMRQRAVTPAFQPIVTFGTRETIGYEALARSSMSGLETPGTMFHTASLVNREAELSMLCRQRAVECGRLLGPENRIFVNTHPLECLRVDVLPSLKILRRNFPDVQLVVEVHERAIDDLTTFREFTAQLRDLEIELAYDDFGAGRARLLELVEVPPQFLKFDAGLIRGIHNASEHQRKLLKMLVEIARDSQTMTLAEGIETREEADVCHELGFDYAQGYYFGKPARLKRYPSGLGISDTTIRAMMEDGT